MIGVGLDQTAKRAALCNRLSFKAAALQPIQRENFMAGPMHGLGALLSSKGSLAAAQSHFEYRSIYRQLIETTNLGHGGGRHHAG